LWNLTSGDLTTRGGDFTKFVFHFWFISKKGDPIAMFRNEVTDTQFLSENDRSNENGEDHKTVKFIRNFNSLNYKELK
jgi:hypothetical protein